MSDKNKLIVLVGRSCVGKTTLVRQIQKYYGNQIHEAVSVTTRDSRQGEIPGSDYHFTTHEKFEEMLKRKELVEYVYYSGNYYGLTRGAFEPETTNIVIVEPNGLGQVKQQLGGIFDIIVIKIEETNLVIKERFQKRGDSIENISERFNQDMIRFAEVDFNYLINSELLLLEAIIKRHTNLERIKI